MRSYLLYLLWGVCCLTLSYCKESEDNGFPPVDNSLAGSINLDRYRMHADIIYGGDTIVHDPNERLFISVGKVADDTLMLTCGTKGQSDANIGIRIPKIPLSGKRFDVSFDYLSHNATIKIKDEVHAPMDARVKGWIKMVQSNDSDKAPRFTPARNEYACNISITSLLEEKWLEIKVTAVRSY